MKYSAFVVGGDKMEKVENAVLDNEQSKKLANKLARQLELVNHIIFMDTRKKAPKIGFFPDMDQYFDPSIYQIHLGYIGIAVRFECKNEEDFQRALTFVQKHESQHVLSTTTKSYKNAIINGTRTVLEYIASVEDPGKRFRREKDYDDYVEELAKRGIYINWQMIQQMVAGIANSLEDGRIEGIASRKYTDFSDLRTYFRGMFWRQSGEDILPEYTSLNAAEKLRVVCNQVLLLATCQLYQPGFYMTYAGTPLMRLVRDLMNNIARAVSSKNCEGMSKECIAICRKLAPLMYEAFKMSKEDIEQRQALEQLIKDMIKAAIESNIDDPNMGGAVSDQEEQGDGNFESATGQSDLEITLSDEEYDKLEEKMKNSGEEQKGGIKIRREHPKDDSEDGESEGAGGSSEETAETSDETGDIDTTDGSSDNYSDEDDSSSKAETDRQNGNSQKITENKEGGPDLNKSPEAINAERNESVISQVEEAMKKAAETTNARAKEVIDAINTDTMIEKKRVQKTKEIIDSDKPVDKEFVKDICKNFVELKRKYDVKDRMPSVLEGRCRTMYRKNKRYFKSLSTPNVSHLDTGSVDPSLIYGLGIGDTDIFRKIGKDKKFNGCAYILLDNSGSMSGDKRIEASKAAAVIEEGFRGLMPLKIVAFDTGGGNIIHEVIKGWNESLRHNCCWNFAVHGREGGGNEDGYDIMIATKELLARPERKKMLCVLSDGAPGDSSLVKKAVKDARKKGIEVYSIYFEEGQVGCYADTFKEMYEKDFVCCELSEVDEHLSKLFQKFSRR